MERFFLKWQNRSEGDKQKMITWWSNWWIAVREQHVQYIMVVLCNKAVKFCNLCPLVTVLQRASATTYRVMHIKNQTQGADCFSLASCLSAKENPEKNLKWKSIETQVIQSKTSILLSWAPYGVFPWSQKSFCEYSFQIPFSIEAIQ